MLSCSLCGYYSDNPIYSIMFCYVCKDKMPVCVCCVKKIASSRVTNRDCLCKSCVRGRKIEEVLNDSM